MIQQKSRTKVSEREFCTRTEVPGLIGVGQWTCDKLIKRSKAGIYVDGRLIVDIKKLMNYIGSITDKSQEEDGTMKSSELKELRCTCGRLLGKSNSQVELRCHRCGEMRVFDDGKLISGTNECK